MSIQNTFRAFLFFSVLFLSLASVTDAQNCETRNDCGPCQFCSGEPAQCGDQSCQLNAPANSCGNGESCIDVGRGNIGICCPAEDICRNDTDCSGCEVCSKVNNQEQGICTSQDCQLAAPTCVAGRVCEDIGRGDGIGLCCGPGIVCQNDGDCGGCQVCSRNEGEAAGTCGAQSCQIGSPTCNADDVCRDFADSPGIGRCCPPEQGAEEAEAAQAEAEAAAEKSGCTLIY
jgi:hypothetical protein